MTAEHERQLWACGYRWVAGLDEVGRGAWAGPVVAAAVILPPDLPDVVSTLGGVRDSKALTPRQRRALCPLISRTAVASSIGMASARYVDQHGIVQATRRAMVMAVRNLPVAPQYLLIDAVWLPEWPMPQRSLIKGDSRVLSIAAASILAKVLRDDIMVALDHYQPGYGFASHKGYGTDQHRLSLQALGPCAAHRFSFAPVRHFHEGLGSQ